MGEFGGCSAVREGAAALALLRGLAGGGRRGEERLESRCTSIFEAISMFQFSCVIKK